MPKSTNAYDLKGRVAIVTGASSGIGKATATLLAECGASVVLATRREDKIAAIAETIRSKGGGFSGSRHRRSSMH